MIYIIDLFDKIYVDAINDFYGFCMFADGSETGSSDKKSKWNEVIRDSTHLDSLVDYVDKIIKENNTFNYMFLPRASTFPRFLRYKEGMHYAYHNDFYQINQLRTDYSVTVFLNSPDDYEGGELVFAVGDTEVEYKLQPGQAIVYPTGLMHKVKPVISGERRVCVFWVESVIADSRIRETLVEYADTLIKNKDLIRPIIADLEKTRYRLIRNYAQF
jgi:PKHD-type hydroxylase|tara:strand:- start:2085 stop:2732 length:648 start_codon:yes stop_codon:yes gene_type:complete